MLPSNFPAQKITTALDWDNLALPPDTLSKIRIIEKWIKNWHSQKVKLSKMRKRKIGYCALFCGTPGNEKSFAASLLGKKTGDEVFKIDLSMTISKYIGETEKNLGILFDKAEKKGWILFFDEADALFGKRTNIRDAHDKYSNQEVSYLLQRVEQYDGLVLIATNMQSNWEEVFSRRFDLEVYFPNPD